MTSIFTPMAALDPGVERLQIQQALSGGGGGGGSLTKVTGATITTPVAYVDLAIPDTGSMFILAMTTVAFSSGGDFIYAAFSFDGGSTFLSDQINQDTYLGGTSMSIGYVSDYPTFTALIGPNDTLSLIFPDNTTVSVARNRLISATPNSSYVSPWDGLKPSATVPPVVPARATTLRIFEYYNGPDPNNIIDTYSFTAGTFTLYSLAT
jgi:hypothetical protein